MNDCVSRVSESCGELVVIVVAMLMISGGRWGNCEGRDMWRGLWGNHRSRRQPRLQPERAAPGVAGNRPELRKPQSRFNRSAPAELLTTPCVLEISGTRLGTNFWW